MSGLSMADLANVARWVAWRTEARRDTGRITKVPKDPHTLRDAASTRPETWGTRQVAEAADMRLPASSHGPGGVGLVLGEWPDGYRLAGVDLDSCRDPVTGAMAPWARSVLALLDTYAEVSPSGTGAKAFFLLPPDAVSALRRAGLLEQGRLGRSFKRGSGADHPPAIELHLGGRYYTVTGEHLHEAPTELREVRTNTIRELLTSIGPDFARSGREHGRLDRSAQAFRLACELQREGKSYADYMAALDAEVELAAWKREKGEAHDGREMRRAWERAGAAASWPEPDLALATAETTPAPALDITIFPEKWQLWITRAAERAGAPIDYVACPLLAAVGATIGNARWGSPWEGWKHPPIVWVACIGNPSAGKSPGMDAVTKPLCEHAGLLNDDWEQRQREYRTAKQSAKEVRSAWEADVKQAVKVGTAAPHEPIAARDPDRPYKRRIYSTDPTSEAARNLSAANSRGLLLHRDELAGWFTSMGKYGNGNAGGERGFWLQAYEGGRWASDRVKDGDDAPDVPHLTWGIVGGFQPDRLASVMLSGDDDGMAARFIYSWPTTPDKVPDRPSRHPLPFDIMSAFRALRELPMPDNNPVTLPFDGDAAEALHEWRQEVKEIEASATGLFLSWIGKLPGLAVRLAIIFAHMAWVVERGSNPEPRQITLDDVSRAVGFLVEYALPMARRAFSEAALPEPERDARRLARWYLRQSQPRSEVLNARTLRRMAVGPCIPTAPRVEAAFKELAELGWVRPAPGRNGETAERQRADWMVNPLVRDAAS